MTEWTRRQGRSARALAAAACLAATLAAALPGAQAQPAATQPPSPALASPRIAAVVNNDIVSSRELGSRIALAILVSGLPDDAETRRRITPQVLRGLIDERLQLQAAGRLNLAVTPAEVDRALAEIAQRNRMTPAQLTELVASRGVDPASLREQLRAQVAWLKVIGREMRPKVVVTRDQIDQALRNGGAGDEELLLSEILLPVYDGDDERAILGQARDLATSIQGGADFAALARQFSAAPSAEGGGDLGWVRLSALAPELQPIVARLRPGQLAEPVRTVSGVQLLGLRERREIARPVAAADAPESDREAARARLEEEQLQRLAARYLRDLRRTAFIDIRL